MKAKIRLIAVLALCAGAYGFPAVLGSIGAKADSGVDSSESYEHDHEDALKARVKGDVLPYAKILKMAHDRIHGDIVEIEFENDGGNWVYEIKYINSASRLVKLYIDAHDGKVLKVEGNGHPTDGDEGPLAKGN